MKICAKYCGEHIYIGKYWLLLPISPAGSGTAHEVLGRPDPCAQARASPIGDLKRKSLQQDKMDRYIDTRNMDRYPDVAGRRDRRAVCHDGGGAGSEARR